MPRFSHSLNSRQPTIPKYRRHKASGQAVVTLSGRDHYLGPWQSKTSVVLYDRLVAEWLVRDRQPPASDCGLTIVELLARYWKHAKRYYRKAGKPTGEVKNIRYALRPLKALYGETPVEEFGPVRLKAVRQKMLDAGLSRPVINARIFIIRRAFKWAVAEGLASASVHTAVSQVESLKFGRTDAREPAPVEPVADDVVAATLPHLPPVVADMVRFQRLTGCRPGEVCALRPGDVDRSKDVWEYRPASHKMQHLSRQRVIFIGPKAQLVLSPYLLRDARAYCFSPRESEARRKAEMRDRRKSKVQPSQRDRSKPHAKRPRDCYDRQSYLTAVYRGCDKAFGAPQGPLTWQELVSMATQRRLSPRDMVRHGMKSRWKRAASQAGLFAKKPVQTKAGNSTPADGWQYMPAIPRWSPNQLRHSAGTALRKEYGLETAQVVLGHSKADVTQIYAERDLAKAAAIIREVG